MTTLRLLSSPLALFLVFQSGSSAHSVSPPPVHAAGPDPIMPPGVVLATELLRMIVRAAPFEALYSMGLSCRVLRGLVSDELYGEGGREAKVNLESFVLYITPRVSLSVPLYVRQTRG